MKIINKAGNSVIADDAIFAKALLKRMKGLLGRKEFGKGQAIILEPCNSIHTFFMSFPIDVLFLNKDNNVIKAIPCVKPFRLTRIYFNAVRCIELPSGTIQNTSIREGDPLLLE